MENFLTLESLHYQGGTDALPTARVLLKEGTDKKEGVATGECIEDALWQAIQRAFPFAEDIVPKETRPRKTSQGREMFVFLEKGLSRQGGKGIHGDAIIALGFAYIEALNRILYVSRVFTAADQRGGTGLYDISPYKDLV